VSTTDNMKEWEKAWKKFTPTSVPEEQRYAAEERAFKAGWEAALEEFIKYTIAQQGEEKQ